MIDKYLNMSLIFDVVINNEHFRTVVKQYRGLDGRTIRNYHTNTFFDTHEYGIEFTDGTQDKYAANIIA